MKFFLFAILIIPLSLFSQISQNAASDSLGKPKVDRVIVDSIDRRIPTELMFLELGGNSIGLGIAYEKLVYKIDSYQRLYFHTGFCVSSAFIFFDGIGVPLTINYVLGRNYNLELTSGVLLYSKVFPSQFSTFGNSPVMLVNNISYRYHIQKYSNSSSVFKIGLTTTYQFSTNPDPGLNQNNLLPCIVISLSL